MAQEVRVGALGELSPNYDIRTYICSFQRYSKKWSPALQSFVVLADPSSLGQDTLLKPRGFAEFDSSKGSKRS